MFNCYPNAHKEIITFNQSILLFPQLIIMNECSPWHYLLVNTCYLTIQFFLWFMNVNLQYVLVCFQY